ncbi:hypothetical protein MY11210_006486 [Beauveria gryllotalpidicola]
MSLQVSSAPLCLSSTPFGNPSACTHLDCTRSPVHTGQLVSTIASSMDDTRAVPLRLDLDAAPYGAASSNPRASSSPGVQSASIVMPASPYPTPTPSVSSMQTIPSDALVEREAKRPRIISHPSGAISNTSTDLHSPAVHQSIEEAHDHLNISYSQASEMVSQPSSAIGVVTSSTMPSDSYPVVGTPYWSNNSLSVEAMGKSTSEGSDANHNLGRQEQMPGGPQSQMYGNSVAWGSQDMSMTMNRMHEYIPRRMTTSSWECEVLPHQQPQHPHQQMRSDGNLASTYESSSAAGSTPQMYGDYLTVNAPAHRLVPSNAYPTSGSISTPSTPHQTPGTAAAWPQPAFQGPAGGRSGVPAGLPRDIKPKILPSSTAASQPTRSSVIQQSAADGDRAKSSGGGGSTGGGGGDRTTHNDVERKYRTNLKDRIAELRAAVPALQAQHDGESDGTSGSAPKVSKGTVLSKATEYIQQLEQANWAMMNEHQQLIERLHTLEAMLQNGGGRHPPHQYTANHGMAMFDPRGFS